MYVKSVAIVSGNSTLLRFFSLECQLRDCAVHTFSRMPSRIDEYDRIFLDTDTVRYHGGDHERVVIVSETYASAEKTHLPWPVATEELAEALLVSVSGGESNVVQAEEPILWLQNRERRELRFGPRVIELSEREWMLLQALAEKEKAPVARESLMRMFDAEGGNIVDVYICHLRKKLDRLCDRRVITTARGVGYCLEISVREEVNQ